MAPHRNHVEARSSRTPARQYVSETHDHKPDAPERTPAIRGPSSNDRANTDTSEKNPGTGA